MAKKYSAVFVLITTLILFSHPGKAESASMEQTVKFAIVTGAVCKRYAEEVGGDVEAYSEMNVISVQMAEKLGYTKDFQALVSELKPMRVMLETMLMEKYPSKVDIYNEWCINVYNGFQNGLARGYSSQ